jgi:hypothetical protein
MFNPTGTVVVNGITDEELVKILEIKIRHEKSLSFNPQQLQPVPASAGTPARPPQQPQAHPAHPSLYNNASFGWNGEDGMEAVHKIIVMLLKKEEKTAAQAQ